MSGVGRISGVCTVLVTSVPAPGARVTSTVAGSTPRTGSWARAGVAAARAVSSAAIASKVAGRVGLMVRLVMECPPWHQGLTRERTGGRRMVAMLVAPCSPHNRRAPSRTGGVGLHADARRAFADDQQDLLRRVSTAGGRRRVGATVERVLIDHPFGTGVSSAGNSRTFAGPPVRDRKVALLLKESRRWQGNSESMR